MGKSNYLYDLDEWKIIENSFDADNHKKGESIFSLGNGKFGQRANFEEDYSGPSMQGTYVAGVYYPDKTRVGWWKNGYPEYFAKVLNAPTWNGIMVYVDDLVLDLANCSVEKYRRELDMKHGVLYRTCIVRMNNACRVELSSVRFISIVDDECACIRYSVKPLNKDVKVKLVSKVDSNVRNEDANYDELFWENEQVAETNAVCSVIADTRKTGFSVGTAMKNSICSKKSPINGTFEVTDNSVSETFAISVGENEELTLYKYVSVVSSLFCPKEEIKNRLEKNLEWVSCKTFDKMLHEQQQAWERKWEHSDITIDGDIAAQQAIRFNIFHLFQTYTGSDERLNIGPKGFTGEKYGGSTYWDTEAYCLPFYLSTSEPKVALQLLKYRHKQLGKAIENAEKLGFSDGAALYPMVTMNGEECHNEWEITFEEIHRNGAVAYAIYDYARYTGDTDYLYSQGIDVLVGIARFWAQRVNFSAKKSKYVMLGVTGPNEYENNVNNNWYTNYIARWCLQYASQTMEELEERDRARVVLGRLGLKAEELATWKEIAENMYLPFDEQQGIIVQNDGFLDKELKPASEIPQDQRPINQHWSWDRILRSCYIKQADVVQGLYFFEENFSDEEIKKNFDYYEQMTVHESSLSPCIYSTVASKVGNKEKAYELYLRTSRLDLDDYNKEADEGLHITSMAGTWISIVKGFAGMRVTGGMLSFQPSLPRSWKSFSFKILFRGRNLRVSIGEKAVQISNESGSAVSVLLGECKISVPENGTVSADFSCD